jgi:alpha-L-fucosidase
MQYAVLTTRHHDGYTLFPSPHASRGVADHLPGRDLVREFVDAARAEQLRVGFYLSLPDWYHDGYPRWTDEMRPYGFAYPRAAPDDWQRFRASLRGQLTQLLSDYGPIDVLWFDGGWERTEDEWGAGELEELIYGLQPDIVLNDRLPGVAGYPTPEQSVAYPPPPEAWETCLTMGESWGPSATDTARKDPLELLGILAEVASGGGNLLLNVSPDGEGEIPPWQAERLEVIAGWMDQHAPAILATEPSGLEPWQHFGPTTARHDGDTTITSLLCPMGPPGLVVLRGVHGRRIDAVRALGTGTTLPHDLRLSALGRIIGGDQLCDVVIHVPPGAADELVTVIDLHHRAPLH